MSTSREEWTKAIAQMGQRSKYGARKKVVDGVTFDSTKEAKRYQELLALQQSGAITNLMRQARYGLYVYDFRKTVDPPFIKVGDYIADFQYFDRGGAKVVEDVKGGKATQTAVYKLKRKIVEASFGIQITEV